MLKYTESTILVLSAIHTNSKCNPSLFNLFAFTIVGDDLISSIGPGLVAFIGIGKDDSEKDIDYL